MYLSIETVESHRRVLHASQITTMRINLIEVLHDQQYRPTAICTCDYNLKLEEIMAGFNVNPTDFTTKCPGCGQRFQPTMIHRKGSTSVELPFFCPAQTQDQMSDLSMLSPDDFDKRHQAVYRAAIVHFGSLRAAFAKFGVDYAYIEKTDWEKKVESFLGELPDTVIAACAGTTGHKIRRMRVKLGIEACKIVR